MRFSLLKTSCILVFVAFITGCSQETILEESAPTSQTISQNSTEDPSGEMMVLGHQLANPYTPENMQAAYASLSDQMAVPSLNITATHYYVRFLPETEEEYDQLVWDNDAIEYFDHPLDYAIEVAGQHYHDPSLPEEAITWQYAVYPVGTDIPNIAHEILSPLFLPDQYNELNPESPVSPDFLDLLDAEAQRQQGYEPDGFANKTTAKWSPSGTISVTDNVSGTTRGVPGVKVRATRGFTVKTEYTNQNGQYSFGHQFNGKVDFSLVWEADDYDLRDGSYGQATYNGPNNLSSGWSYTITTGMTWIHAHVQRAADCYYYHNGEGLKKPTDNNFWHKKLKIGVMNSANRSFFAPAYRWIAFPEIKVFKSRTEDGTTIDNNARRLFETTTHEIAHASHWDMIGHSRFQQADDNVVESWAVCVAWRLTSNAYGNNSIDWNSVTFGLISSTLENKYYPVGIDLVDNINQRALYNDPNYPLDNVSGYSVEQIEDALGAGTGAKTLEVWRDNLKNLFNNPTEASVDELFNNYVNL